VNARQEEFCKLPHLVHRASKYLEALARQEGVELAELLRHVCLSLNVGFDTEGEES